MHSITAHYIYPESNMTNDNEKDKALFSLKTALDSYAEISDVTWGKFQQICRFRDVNKHEILCAAGDIPSSFSFVYYGLFRVFVVDEKGNEYNKLFFDKNSFTGAMSALLKSAPSRLTIEALETSAIIEIDFSAYRKLLIDAHDLKLFQIYYLEKNWLLAKDAREIQIIQEDATQRYKRFLKDYPTLSERITQYHIASHLGITATQLSRIRKNI